MMRPFSLELAYVSGWHDGERVHIAEPNDPHVVVHEDVHADILRTTPDGQLLWFSILLSSQSDTAVGFIGEHVEQSRQAQECFATYVGSKSFVEPSDRLSAKESLNQEYQDYYRLMGDILAPVVKSDFLKVALAMASMQLIFSSKALHLWATNGFDYTMLLHDVPNSRLDAFRDWWSHTGSDEIRVVLHNCLEEQDWIKNWANERGLDGPVMDFIDDDDQLLEDRAFCRELDAYLIPKVFAHLSGATLLDVISEVEWQEALELVVQEAQSREISLELEPGYDDLRSADYRMSASGDARTYIRSSPSELVEGAAQLDRREFRWQLASSDTVVGAIFSPEDDESNRCHVELLRIVPSNDGSRPQTDFLSFSWIAAEDAVSDLLGYSEAVQDETELRNLGCILIPVSQADVIGRLQACALNKELCIYLDEDVFEFAIDHSTDFEFGFGAFEARGDVSLTAFWGRPKHTGSPHVLKCMPRETGRLFFAHMVRRGDVSVVDNPPPVIVAEAIRLVTHYWRWL